MLAIRGWTVLWSVARFRRRALLPTILIAGMVVLALTIGAASAMADVLNTSLAGDECVCGSDDSSTSVSVPGDPPGDPPATGLILPNTGSAGLLGTGVGPHLSLLHFILALALILIAAGGLGLVVERPVLAAQTISGADESTKG